MIPLVWLHRMTSFDRKLILLVALAVLVSFLLPLQQVRGTRVVISSGNQVLFFAPLDQDRQVDLTGPLGETRIQILGGGVSVLSSPCAKKICVGMGIARHVGDLIACVPNQMVIRIDGAEAKQGGYDLLSH